MANWHRHRLRRVILRPTLPGKWVPHLQMPEPQKLVREKIVQTFYDKDGVVTKIVEHTKEYDKYEWTGGSGWDNINTDN